MYEPSLKASTPRSLSSPPQFSDIKDPWNEEGELGPRTCTKFGDCFMFVMYWGLTNGGGIGEAMVSGGNIATRPKRIIFDLLFFVVVLVLELNVVFGIIIDTFSQLREQHRQRQECDQQCLAMPAISRNSNNQYANNLARPPASFAFRVNALYATTAKQNQLSILNMWKCLCTAEPGFAKRYSNNSDSYSNTSCSYSNNNQSYINYSKGPSCSITYSNHS